ncbi:hypothetical protein TRVA0_037S01090 [Trichomonascus vanleenenianus]|uniref:uncharacterized protein n=1 Tax=Trichomonascus vanleenenianus TaxID=2268995 RepID=UPI003ECB31F5
MASKSASTLSVPGSSSKDKGRIFDLRQARDRPYSFLEPNSESPLAPIALQPIRSDGLLFASPQMPSWAHSTIDQRSAVNTSGTSSRRLSQSSAFQERARNAYRQSLLWFRKKLADRNNKHMIRTIMSEPRLGDDVYRAREERERHHSYVATNEKANQNSTPRCFCKWC